MQTTMVILGLIIVVFGIILFTAKAKMKNIPLPADNEKIITLTDKNFQHQINNRTILVDFWASWCMPCRMMAPILNEVSAELKEGSKVGKLNIEQFQSIAQNYKVRNIPTMILFKNGKEIKRFVGVKNKDFLLEQIKTA